MSEEKKQTTRAKVLVEAHRITLGDREQAYGSPLESFNSIASFWNVFLFQRGMRGVVLDGTDVALMMDLLKTSRLMTGDTANYDTWVDKAGYSALGAEVAGATDETDQGD